MLTLLKNAHVFAPEDLGTKDILIANGVIEAIDDQLDVQGVEVEVIDCKGMRLIPGFIDGHVHITGGGGEGGFHTRTPEMPLSSATRCGVTTICGLCGTDGVTRSQENLLAKAYALENEGLTAYMYVGSYEVPTPTITGSIRSDIMLIDKCIGAGEIAVSDHRSSQ
ncbi:MAG: amidohydrolase family protein, partial [Negativicoccus succinicivorans]|nr:amidohydrolase family protein [Negativicoccus succinicivorans]